MFRRQKNNTGRKPRTPNQPKQGVFSYSANQTIRASGQKRQSASQQAPTHARSVWWQHAWIRNLPSLIALTAISLSVLYCLGLSTYVKVVVSAASPQSLVLRDKSEYQQGAQRILSQSLLNRTKFTINSGSFVKAFQAEYPEVADASITLPLISRRPVVTISTAQPQLILTAQGQAYVLDKRGTVIMTANDLNVSLRNSLPVVNDQSGLTVEVGKSVLPTEDIQFIATVLAQLKAKQVPIESVTLPKVAHEVDIKPAGQPYYVKFSIDTHAREAAGTYLAAKQRFEQTNSLPSQYVDVRVPGRVYYQ